MPAEASNGEEIPQQLHAVFGGHGFRMELYSVDGQLAVLKAHNFPFMGFRGDLEAVGKGSSFHDEGVVSCGGERLGEILEQALVRVLNG